MQARRFFAERSPPHVSFLGECTFRPSVAAAMMEANGTVHVPVPGTSTRYSNDLPLRGHSPGHYWPLATVLLSSFQPIQQLYVPVQTPPPQHLSSWNLHHRLVSPIKTINPLARTHTSERQHSSLRLVSRNMQRWLRNTLNTNGTGTSRSGKLPSLWNPGHRRRLPTSSHPCSAYSPSYHSRPLSSLVRPFSMRFPNSRNARTRIRHFSVSGAGANQNNNAEDPAITPPTTGVVAVDIDTENKNDEEENFGMDNNEQDEEEDDGGEDDDVEDDPFLEESVAATRLVFRENLNNWYRVNFDVSLSDAFVTVPAPPSEDYPTGIRWTSTFVCPITNHEVKGEYLPGIPDPKGSFETKKLASQAAALQAMNFFCPIEEKASDEAMTQQGAKLARKKLQLHYMKEHKIVLTDNLFHPQKVGLSGKKKGGTWWTCSFQCPVEGNVFPAMELAEHEARDLLEDGQIWYRRKGHAIQAACERVLKDITTDNAGIQVEQGIYSGSLSTEPLTQWYRTNHDLDLTNENFVVTTGSWKGSGGNLWTATFICPIMGDRYDSGEILRMPRVSNEGGIQWYKRKNDAMTAAALHAYDALVFRTTGKNQPRFCREDPSGKDTGIYDSEENVTVIKENDEKMAVRSTPHIDEITFIADDDEDKDTNVDQEITETDEEDEDDYIVEFVPQRIGESFGGTTASSTLDLVVETWIHSSRPGNKIPTNITAQPVWTTNTSKQIRAEAIERAHAWVSQQQEVALNRQSENTSFDRIGTPSSRTIAKMLIRALARANRAVSEENEPSGIEEAAKSIIDFLFSSPAALPDADCFALYIQCLEGRGAAKNAATIFDAMKLGTTLDGHILPRPNTDVFNSLIQRKAESLIRTDLVELEGVKVNKETFLSCLSAVAHATGQGGFGFDSQYILDCIQEMKVRGGGNDPSLKVDIDVYNAPMRWNGNVGDALLSRPYTRPIAWDGLNKSFESREDIGIQNELNDNHPAIREAQAIENWFRSIDAQAFGSYVRPNIETYESAIQAWIRTQTSKGLDHAEKILELLCSKQNEELKIRSQTIHPFIAALAHVGDYDRVDKWIQKLAENGQIFYDSRLRAAPILARVASKKGHDSTGEKCLLLLQEAVDEAKLDGSMIVEAQSFAMVIDAFRNQTTDNINMERITIDSCLGIQRTIELFDEFLASLIGFSDSDRLVQQLHLMHFAPTIYASAFSALRDLRSEADASLPQYLEWLERFLRRAGEHSVLSENLHEQSPHVGLVDGQPINEDGYSYSFERVLRVKAGISWQDYFNSMVHDISQMYPWEEERSIELVRLLVLASSLLQRDGNDIQLRARNSTNYLDEIHIEHTNPLVAQMRKEFGNVVSHQFVGRRRDNLSPRKSGDPKEKARIAHENRRRKRKEKVCKKPTQRPRKRVAQPA